MATSQKGGDVSVAIMWTRPDARPEVQLQVTDDFLNRSYGA